MRPVALGRKNWLHIGSPQAGQKVAAILSLVESCRRLKLPVRDYLAAILPGLAGLPICCLPTLLPLRGWPGIQTRKRPWFRRGGICNHGDSEGRPQTNRRYNSAKTAVV